MLDEPLPFRVLDIGGPGNYSNLDVMNLYARLAGVEPRASHLPTAMARLLSLAAARNDPGRARILKLMSLSEHAHPERFDGAAMLERPTA